ncbi:hypothetical protein Tco_0210121 [Tanacetum coccineum]
MDLVLREIRYSTLFRCCNDSANVLSTLDAVLMFVYSGWGYLVSTPDCDNTDEVANVLSTLEAANVLSSGGAASTPTGVATASGSFPTAAIFTIASVTTPYTRRTRASRGIVIESSKTTSVPLISAKGKRNEKMVESKRTKKKKVLEQLDAQVAKELEYEFAREEQLISEKSEKDAEIARAQTERELGIMITELDRSNELIAKYTNVYEQAEADLSLEEKMELITELIKYQRNLAEIKKGMTFEQIEENFIPVWKHMQDFVPMNSKLKSLEHSQEQQTKDPKELSEEELKKMMELVPIEEKFNKEDLDRLWSLVKKTFSTSDHTEDKEKQLWVELKRLYEPDPRDQLWALQRYMHDPLVWRLYDTCGVHHVSIERGYAIFILVEKDYPLTKGLTTMMLCNKLQVDEYSKMANQLLMKINSIANSPR